ncbi:YitT family protein [Ligilactobacillus ruminis]|uniref:YitT family protein n=1 Tax=Ligilactobacillus ruminis TaxID=1623 RepID=UPI0034A404AC
MDELQDVLKQHAMIMKATTALFYGILVSIAMNFFWEPGHIYSSGITGLALKNGISTGGLDILGLTIRKHTGKSIGTINLIFNFFIILAAGAVFGWPYAFYSALSIFINARVMDMVYTKQQKMQVMIVTTKPKSVIDCIQNRMRRGITIVHGAEGAYKHDEKTILFTVISRYEQPELRRAMIESDPAAFVSIADNVHIMGRFYEPEP